MQLPQTAEAKGQQNRWTNEYFKSKKFLCSPCFKIVVSQIKVNSVNNCIKVHNFWLGWPFWLFTLASKSLAVPLILSYFTVFSTFCCLTAADSCIEKEISGRFVPSLFGSWKSFALYSHAFWWENFCVKYAAYFRPSKNKYIKKHVENVAEIYEWNCNTCIHFIILIDLLELRKSNREHHWQLEKCWL